MTDQTGQRPDLNAIADQLAIYHVLTTHSRGVDRADAEALKSCYWPESTVAYGGFNGIAHEFCEMLPGAIRKWARTQHSITNVNVSLRGQDARVETYVTAYHYMANDGGQDTEMTYLGRYLDRFERRGDVWKIAHRQVLMDWNQNADATAILEGPPFDGLARGERHPEDPLYRHLA